MGCKQIYECLILGLQIDIVNFSPKNELVFNVNESILKNQVPVAN